MNTDAAAMENSRAIKGPDYARQAIALTATNPKLSARMAMARAVEAHGNYDEAGKLAWREYLNAGCPAAKVSS